MGLLRSKKKKEARPIDFHCSLSLSNQSFSFLRAHQPGVGALFFGGSRLEDAGGAAAHRLREGYLEEESERGGACEKRKKQRNKRRA